jgi:hypothetical protein
MSDAKEIKKLEVPQFESDLPPHLLDESTKQERYIMEQLSVQKQQNAYIIDKLTEVHYSQQKTQAIVDANSERIEKLEVPGKLLKSKPVMIAVAIVAFTFLFVVYPYLLSLEFKELMPILKDFFL